MDVREPCATAKCPENTTGRYVYAQLRGTGNFFHLAEVLVAARDMPSPAGSPSSSPSPSPSPSDAPDTCACKKQFGFGVVPGFTDLVQSGRAVLSFGFISPLDFSLLKN